MGCGFLSSLAKKLNRDVLCWQAHVESTDTDARHQYQLTHAEQLPEFYSCYGCGVSVGVGVGCGREFQFTPTWTECASTNCAVFPCSAPRWKMAKPARRRKSVATSKIFVEDETRSNCWYKLVIILFTSYQNEQAPVNSSTCCFPRLRKK